MELLHMYVVAVLLGCGSVAAWPQAATPEGALEEMLTTKKLDVFASHLPVKLMDMLASLDSAQKKEILTRFHSAVLKEQADKTIHKHADGRTWDLLRDDQRFAVITLVHSFISGSDALLQLNAIQYPDRVRQFPTTFFVGMRLEAGDWRVVNLNEAHLVKNFESEEFAKQALPVEHNGADAASMLRTLNTVLVTYSTTYPDRGYPPSFRELSGAADDDASEQHARLLDPRFLADKVIIDGYEYQYHPAVDGYTITATPVEYGITGKESFFTDATAVVRHTSENRLANEQDPSLDGND